MVLNLAVCDDSENIWNEYKDCFRYITEPGLTLSTSYFLDGTELVDEYEGGKRFDIIFMDIEMLEMDGIETAKKIREKDNYVILIYVSSHEHYCRQLFQVNPFDFLLKPIECNAFLMVWERAKNFMEKNSNQFFEYANKKEMIRIPYSEILYFESKKRIITIYTLRDKYSFYGKLDDIEKQIKEITFFRIHKSYLVNCSQIRAFRNESVELYNGMILGISENRRKIVKEQLMDAWEESS